MRMKGFYNEIWPWNSTKANLTWATGGWVNISIQSNWVKIYFDIEVDINDGFSLLISRAWPEWWEKSSI